LPEPLRLIQHFPEKNIFPLIWKSSPRHDESAFTLCLAFRRLLVSRQFFKRFQGE